VIVEVINMDNEMERLGLRVLSRDKRVLRRLAASEGEAMSVVVRRLIRDAARERGLWSADVGNSGQHQDGGMGDGQV
jgi:hypothetical protein